MLGRSTALPALLSSILSSLVAGEEEVVYKNTLGNLGVFWMACCLVLVGTVQNAWIAVSVLGTGFGLGELTDGSGFCACNRNMKESEHLQACSTITDYFWSNTSNVFCICSVFYIHCKALLDVSSLQFMRETQKHRKFIGGDNLVLIVIASMSSKLSWVIFVFISFKYFIWNSG